jgi:hypothetical protein
VDNFMMRCNETFASPELVRAPKNYKCSLTLDNQLKLLVHICSKNRIIIPRK